MSDAISLKCFIVKFQSKHKVIIFRSAILDQHVFIETDRLLKLKEDKEALGCNGYL